MNPVATAPGSDFVWLRNEIDKARQITFLDIPCAGDIQSRLI